METIEADQSRILWWSDSVRLRVVSRWQAARFFELAPQLVGLWDRHAFLGALGRRYLRSRADASIVRWGNDEQLTGSIYSLDRYDVQSGGYISVGVSGWWRDPVCWPDTVKFRWQALHPALGRGLGKQLIQLSGQAIRLECPEACYVSESCPVWQRALIRYYQRLGFQRWDDPDRRGVGVPLVPTVSLRLSLVSLPPNEWGYPYESLDRLRKFYRPTHGLRFRFEPDPRYGI